MPSVFLTAHWKNLIMANYWVKPSMLEPFLPAFTELDEWGGKCYVSLVGFMFLNTRIKGVAIPFHQNFEEVNLRFYVRHHDGTEWKRGVVFIKELVPKPMLSLVANTLYGEHYQAVPMRNEMETLADGSISVGYSWKIGENWDRLQVTVHPSPTQLVAGSKEEFITQHYWGYTKMKNGLTSTYQVEHPSWRVFEVKHYNINVSGEKLYGKELGQVLNGEPESVLMAEGSNVAVKMGSVIK